MNLLEILRIFGISARFCRNFQEFKGILEILTDFGIFLGFLRDFFGIFTKVYEDFQSNIPLEGDRMNVHVNEAPNNISVLINTK